MSNVGREWRIVGGKENGLLVRDDDGIENDLRLQHGAIVNEIEKKGDKLKYMISVGTPSWGKGPSEGWIAIKIKNKILAQPADAPEAGYPGGAAKAAPKAAPKAEAKAKAKAAAAPKEAADATEVYGLVEGESAWQLWKPMPESSWSKWPRAGAGEKPTAKIFKERMYDVVPGEFWGLDFPISPKMFKEWGPEWLTKAMHKAGTLPKDNEVTEFTEFDVVAEDVANMDSIGGDSTDWGGAGPKVLLGVKYKNGPGELKEGMFVKFPHEFSPKNERIKLSINAPIPSGWLEVMFYNSISGRLPLSTPRGYFGDMSRWTTNYILITERVPYGSKSKKISEFAPGELLPAPPKYRDWAIENCADYYYAHARSMAKFFAWSKGINKETTQVDEMFNDKGALDFSKGLHAHWGAMSWEERDKSFAGFCTAPANQWIAGMGFNPNVAQGMLDMGKDMFTNRAPNVFPKELMSKSFLDRFMKEATEMSKYVAEFNFYNLIHPEYRALAHNNAQVDNAYYWRDEDGDLVCGLLDWDGVSNTSMPQCLGNAWMGSEPDVFDEHEEKLIVYCLDEFKKASGEELDVETFYMCYKLAQAAVMYGCFSNLGVLHRMIKPDEWKAMKDRFDPRIDKQFLTRCYFVQVELFLWMFRKRSPYEHYQKFMKRTKMPKK